MRRPCYILAKSCPHESQRFDLAGAPVEILVVCLTSMGSEAQAEQVTVANINEHSVSQNIAAYETLNMLALERRFQDGRFYQDVIREQQSHKEFVAGYVSGRRSIDVGHTNRVETELPGQALTNDAAGCASVNHRSGGDGSRN